MLEAEDGAPQDYDSVRRMLLDAASDGPVFFKDMSYYVVPRIFEDLSPPRPQLSEFERLMRRKPVAREKGKGRPSKKERREMVRLRDV